jgi:hypothetical protein
MRKCLKQYDPAQITAKALLCFNNKYASNICDTHSILKLVPFQQKGRFTIIVKNPIHCLRQETSN